MTVPPKKITKNNSKKGNSQASWVKKTLTTSIGTFFLTEEAIRKILLEMKLPKEIASSILQQADKTRSDFSSFLEREIEKLTSSLDFDKILQKILNEATIEINAKISITKKKKGKTVS